MATSFLRNHTAANFIHLLGLLSQQGTVANTKQPTSPKEVWQNEQNAPPFPSVQQTIPTCVASRTSWCAHSPTGRVHPVLSRIKNQRPVHRRHTTKQNHAPTPPPGITTLISCSQCCKHRRVLSQGSCPRWRVCAVPLTTEPKGKGHAYRCPRPPSHEVAQGVECERDEDKAGDPVRVCGPKSNHTDSQGKRELGSRLQQLTVKREKHIT